jgi:hypothetical protein
VKKTSYVPKEYLEKKTTEFFIRMGLETPDQPPIYKKKMAVSG